MDSRLRGNDEWGPVFPVTPCPNLPPAPIRRPNQARVDGTEFRRRAAARMKGYEGAAPLVIPAQAGIHWGGGGSLRLES